MATAIVLLVLGGASAPAVDPIALRSWTGILTLALALAIAAFLVLLGVRAAGGRAREAELRLRSILDSAQDPVVSWAPDGRILEWNPAAERMFGFARAVALSRLDVATILPGVPAELPWTDDDEGLPGSGGRIEIDAVAADGAVIPVEMAVSSVALGSDQTFNAILYDLSERRAAESSAAQLQRRLEQKAAELERSNTELDQFASAVSHDLAQPLIVVTRYAEMLQDRCSEQLDEDGKKFVAAIVRGGARMQTLIDGLLRVARVGGSALPDGVVDTRAAVAHALEGLEQAISASHAEVEIDELPEVLGDQVQVEQVFQNLIGNSIKFSNGDAPRVRVSALPEGERVTFTVSDNGVGIPPERADTVFQIFKQLRPTEYEGQGIGLAISKRIVDRHGGQIWVDPTVSSGTAVSFTLPSAEAEREAAA